MNSRPRTAPRALSCQRSGRQAMNGLCPLGSGGALRAAQSWAHWRATTGGPPCSFPTNSFGIFGTSRESGKRSHVFNSSAKILHSKCPWRISLKIRRRCAGVHMRRSLSFWSTAVMPALSLRTSELSFAPQTPTSSFVDNRPYIRDFWLCLLATLRAYCDEKLPIFVGSAVQRSIHVRQ